MSHKIITAMQASSAYYYKTARTSYDNAITCDETQRIRQLRLESTCFWQKYAATSSANARAFLFNLLGRVN